MSANSLAQTLLPGRSKFVAGLLGALLSLGFITLVAGPSQAADPCVSGNAIACENSKPGSSSSEWEIGGKGDDLIEGFTTDISTNVGGTVNFKIHSTAAYTMDIYRMGYYGGDGARKQATVTTNTAVSQANLPSKCINNSSSTGLIDCGTWGVSATWIIPTTAVSGVYFAHIMQAGGADAHVMFVVRNDASHSDLIFQTSDTSWQAYNNWGGNSLYAGEPAGRAYKVSYNRPFNTRGTPGGRDFVWANEYPMIRFLEAQGYDVSYQSGVDTDRYGSLLANHKTFLSVGHDEYWSGNQRKNVEAARDAGVNLAFFSANEVYWKTRYEPSVDGSSTNYRTLVTYKESADNARTDPEDIANGTWTGTWRDPRFSPPADGGRPENNLTGTIFTVNSGTNYLKVPAADGKLRFWRNTAAATQAAGATYNTPQGTLGYEWDEDLDNGFRPAGAIKMSTANWDVPEKLTGYDSTVAPGNATHSLVLYRASSGALVFGAGTVQWTWGLDATHDGDTTPTDPAMRQATINLLADMNAQPTTLESNLTAATKSTDTTAPTAVITSPASGANLPSGGSVTVTGTASDVGGVVGGVEVSLDGGTTWHPATGRDSWSYTGTVNGVGATTIQARASDDSANLQATPTTRSITVACPCSLLSGQTPAVASDSDTSSIELGVRFQSTTDGYITGVKFYKGASNTGTHTGTLWSAAGEKLASGTFANESATGWQTLQFSDAVRVSAGQSYIASYHAPSGGYSTTAGFFTGHTETSSPLSAPATTDATPNGVYAVGSAVAFPNSTFKGGNYWVSPIFDTVGPPDTTPPSVTGVTPIDNSSSIRVTTKPTAGFSEPIKAGSLTLQLSSSAGLVSGTTTFDSARKVATFTPSADLAVGTTYTLKTAGGTDDAGNALPVFSSTFKTVTSSTPGSCPCTIWSDSDVPATATVNDSASVELGVKFTASDDGFINGVRFYKGPQNVGTHTGTLWTSTGTELATTTFVNESSTGWQEALFSKPVAITAGTTYVASYHTSGFYSATSGALASAVTNGPLTALASSAAGGNGVYGYGGRALPTNSYGAASYGVDVVYDLPVDVTPPAVASAVPGASASSVPVSSIPVVTFSEKVVSGLNITLKTGSTTVPATVALDSTGRTATITPGAALQADTTYTVTVSGAADKTGNVMTSYSYTFTTSGTASCPCTIYASDYVPAVPASSDTAAIELGVRFTPASNGYITGMRFYKGTTNTGSHVGSLWTADGALLTSASFSSETASGWQTVAFPGPVAVTAGVTYVASYSAPNGHYSADAGQFAADVKNAPLTAPASSASAGNGVFSSTLGRFPASSYNSTGYGVDVLFATANQVDTVPPGVLKTSPVDGATSVAPATAPVVTFNEAVSASSIQASITAPDGTVVPSAVAAGADQTVTLTPASVLAYATKYTAQIKAADMAGNVMAAPVSWSFTTAKAPTTACPCSIWTDETAPAVASDPDGRSIEVGVKFVAASNGYVTGLRFYKGPGNSGTHVGTLWSSTGTELAKATFTNESVSGWQQVSFEDAVAVTAGTTYVASYHANQGAFSTTVNGLQSAVTRGPLTAPAGTADAPNGVYLYGDRAFPTGGTSTNFWVDAVFDTVPPADVKPPTVTAISPADASSYAAVSASPSATFSEPINPSSAQVTLKNAAGTAVSGTTSYDATSRTLKLNPALALANNTSYTATVTASDLAGNALAAPKTWTFTTTPVFSCPCTLFSDTVPAGGPVTDTAAVELGTRFTPRVSGYVTGVRFYKASANTGTHTGSLWDAAGTKLATGTFLSETASGWQTLIFPTAVPVTAGTVYTASYYAPNGQFSRTANFFAADYSSGPLLAPGGANGVFVYGTGGVAPASSSSASNYWVDPVFSDTAPKVTNLALSKTATQSSDALGGVAARAVDGNTDGVWANNSVTHTNGDANAWWQVDLGRPSTINSVKVSNRTDCCSDRLNNAVVFIGATNLGSRSYTDLQADSSVLKLNIGATAPASISLSAGGFTGRYVKVQLPGTNNLSLAEVEVFGTPVADTTPPVISAVSVSPVSNGAAVTWTTDEPSTSVVKYGASATSLTSTATGTSNVTAHAVTLTGLSTSTPYFYRVVSADADGNSATSPATASAAATFTTSGNLALGKTATESSTAADASRAVDGNTDGVFNNGSVSHTNSDANAWWQVDLGSSQTIRTINVWNRTDCCASRLNNAVVFISAADMSTRTFAQLQADTTVTKFNLGTVTAAKTSLAVPAVAGRYVKVQLSTTDYLHLAEVQVYDTDQTPPVTTAVAASATAASAIVNWTTDEASTSVVQYGTSATALSTTVTGTGNVTAHSVALPGLNAGSKYYYRVVSADAAGNSTTSPDPASAAASFSTTPTSTNLAQGKTVTQSSTAFGGLAGRAVDGTTDGVFNNGSVSHTDVDANAWWQVDLGASTPIGTVSVFNRTDCCSDRLNGAVVFISTTDMSGRTFAQLQADTTVTKLSIGNPAPASINLDTAAVSGRYIKVQLPGTNYLSLAEVRVYAPADTTPPVTTAVAASATAASAIVNWTTDEASTSVVQYGTSATALSTTVTGTGNVTAHSVVLPGLANATQYYYRVVSADAAGNSTTSPATASAAASFTTTASSTNLAQGKTATQSSTANSAPASRAVDGTTDGVFANNSVTSTNADAGAWWQVDLGAATAIGTVSVFNRTDCCSDRLNGAVVFISAADMSARTYAQLQADTTVTKLSIGNPAPASINLNAGSISGRFVKVQLPGTNNLSLAEVRVYAPPAPVITAVASGTPAQTTATVTWTSDKASTSVVAYGTSATSLGSSATGTSNVTAHSVNLTGLTAGTQYYYRVTSADSGGASATSPDSSASAATFTTAAPTNLALNKTVTTTSSLESSPWGAAKAVDGVYTSTSASTGWTSTNSLTTNHTEYIQVDLGSSQSVKRVSLYPRSDAGNVGAGFPVNFTVSISTNGTTWTTVNATTGAAQPTTTQQITFTAANARYVRVTGTSLRANPNDGNQYRMQLAEVGVY